MLPEVPYRERVEEALRPEEVIDAVHEHIWDAVNAHLGTSAHSFPELVEQLGMMRFGHRPRVADTFCGSGQIPFEAARLGCDVYASDLNPVACMLTWGASISSAARRESRRLATRSTGDVAGRFRRRSTGLASRPIATAGSAKVFLYCVEARCPQTGWMVPLLPTRVVSKGIAWLPTLFPDAKNRRTTSTFALASSATELAS